MSKRVKLILSSIITALLITLLSSFSPAFAYPGGLLDGKSLSYGFGLGNFYMEETKTTDNNTNTGENIGTNGSSVIWYNFDKPYTISAYELYSQEGPVLLNLYDVNKVLLSSITTIDKGIKQTIDKIPDVSYVMLTNTSKTVAAVIREFDVFGEVSVPPTPTPLETPEPTLVPTAEPTPTPEIPSGDRAILTVTLTAGIEKEFDLPMSEVNGFLTWYDSAAGSARYGINKHDNNKGPFNKRTEYVIHDKILTFEVSEYTAQ